MGEASLRGIAAEQRSWVLEDVKSRVKRRGRHAALRRGDHVPIRNAMFKRGEGLMGIDGVEHTSHYR